jgi:L-seryl-tRNA(Ser) seleniumtransferase
VNVRREDPGAGGHRGLRALPSVDRLATELARTVLKRRREELLAGENGEADLLGMAEQLLEPSLRPVINATGVILHTNLGRAPLPGAARAALQRAAAGYSNLEYDAARGKRGSRRAHVEPLLRELTGAEAGFAVNNCAGAVTLAAAALAGGGRELIVSRGQLIEIGGSFRIPEVVAQAGARLVEVGTTNRTRLSDYSGAIGPDAGAIMRAHPSNFRTLGFVEHVEIEELCGLPVPVIDDVGSGVLADELELLADEPPVRRSVRAGAALVCFSGDKLLGGPQAGIIVGRAEAVDRAARHPLARALRIDKLSLAALEATLALYRDPDLAAREIPALAMLLAGREELEQRALAIARVTGGQIVEVASRVGGGALPLTDLEGPAVSVDPGPQGADALAAKLRAHEPPVVALVRDGRLLLDPRTLDEREASLAAQAVLEALS